MSIPRPTNVETTNMGTTYHVQEDGSKVIAPTRRPDGTYRKPIRVRAGYTPLEENLYKGPEVQRSFQARGGLPPGATPEMVAPAGRGSGSSSRPPGFPPGYVPPEPKAKAQPKVKAAAPPAASKAPPAAPKAALPDSKAASEEKTAGKPENRLRNLRKKLAEITTLEERLEKEGDAAVSEEMHQKLSRKGDLEAEVAELEAQLAQLQVS